MCVYVYIYIFPYVHVYSLSWAAQISVQVPGRLGRCRNPWLVNPSTARWPCDAHAIPM